MAQPQTSRMQIEKTVVFADSVPCTTVYCGADYFTSTVLLGAPIFKVECIHSYRALEFLDRLFHFLNNKGYCHQEPYDSTATVYTLQFLQKNCQTLRALASDDVLTVIYGEPERTTVFSINNGRYYKNGEDQQLYTNPEANLQLWQGAILKRTDHFIGRSRGTMSRKLKTTQTPKQCAFALPPELFVSPVDRIMVGYLDKWLREYIVRTASSSAEKKDKTLFSKGPDLHYASEILLGCTGTEFECKITVNQRRVIQEPALVLTFTLLNENFSITHPEGREECDRASWLRNLALSVCRAWTHPEVLIGFWFKAAPGDSVVELERRVVVVEKEVILCSVCHTSPLEIAYIPCGHMVCEKCAPKLQTECPFCRGKIERNLKVFF